MHGVTPPATASTSKAGQAACRSARIGWGASAQLNRKRWTDRRTRSAARYLVLRGTQLLRCDYSALHLTPSATPVRRLANVRHRPAETLGRRRAARRPEFRECLPSAGGRFCDHMRPPVDASSAGRSTSLAVRLANFRIEADAARLRPGAEAPRSLQWWPASRRLHTLRAAARRTSATVAPLVLRHVGPGRAA
jgi:hypothetical protein